MGSGIQEPTIEQKQAVFALVEEEIAKTEYKRVVGKIKRDNSNLTVKNSSVMFARPLKTDIKKSFNWLDKIYNHIAANRVGDFGEFFHFKNFERGLEIIQNRSLRLFSLESQSENDYAELSEYYFKYSRPNHFHTTDSTIREYRDKTFIFCFTKNFRNERFWSDYARNDTGLALGFTFTKFKWRNFDGHYCQFRDVFYDDGYALDFINEIRAKVMRKCKVNVDFEPYVCIWFPYFYKRVKYLWEDETRLAVYGGNTVRGALSDIIFDIPKMKMIIKN